MKKAQWERKLGDDLIAVWRCRGSRDYSGLTSYGFSTMKCLCQSGWM
jgi:hypothetical protein